MPGAALLVHASPALSKTHPARPTLRAPVRLHTCAMASSQSSKKTEVAEMYRGYHSKFEGLPEMKAKDLKALIDKKDPSVVVVDSRLADEQAVAMIPTAITKEQYEAGEAAYAGRRAVCYCTVGYRSGMFAESLRKKGRDAYNLEGSILGWAHEGYPLVKGDPGGGGATEEPSKRLHVFGDKWNILPEGVEGVVFKKTPWIKLGVDAVGGFVGGLFARK